MISQTYYLCDIESRRLALGEQGMWRLTALELRREPTKVPFALCLARSTVQLAA